MFHFFNHTDCGVSPFMETPIWRYCTDHYQTSPCVSAKYVTRGRSHQSWSPHGWLHKKQLNCLAKKLFILVYYCWNVDRFFLLAITNLTPLYLSNSPKLVLVYSPCCTCSNLSSLAGALGILVLEMLHILGRSPGMWITAIVFGGNSWPMPILPWTILKLRWCL